MPRYFWLDSLRAVALVAMVAFHFCFDLSWFGFLHVNFYTSEPVIFARCSIVTAFLLIVGMSLVLANRKGFNALKFWKRVGLIALAAAAVSVATRFVFPETWIYFGVLQNIVVSTLVAQLFIRRPWLALALGAILVAAHFNFSADVFNSKPMSVIGFVTVKPYTEDYVPLVPWTGVVLIGVALMTFLLKVKIPSGKAPRGKFGKIFQFLGRHTLVIYLIHQPILWGIFCLVTGTSFV